TVKAKIIIFLIPIGLLACSRPATTDEINKAIAKCYGVSFDVSYQTSSKGALREGRIVTKRDLNSFLKDCLKDMKERQDPNSKRNILKRQRALVSGF
ncbi:hypothetical protein, partial [Acinetobacter nosocomialis]|uniref:hypothetical protein n=1 Tax=Acinetobacter nosocomialis TaxID=106654 RepID=UPI001F227A41